MRKKTQVYDITNWMSVSTWLQKWLSCDVGKESNPTLGPDSAEGLLSGRYIVAREDDIEADNEMLPARAWLRFGFARGFGISAAYHDIILNGRGQ
jgi:hypothetical protein